MAIRVYLSDPAAFDQNAINAMSDALVRACRELCIGSETKDREIIAERIIALARSGIVDADALAARIVAEAKAMRSL